MIRTTKAPVAFPVPWGEGNAHFMLRAGDVIERGVVEAELAEFGAGRVFDFQLEECFAEGIAVLLADSPDDVERIREVSAAAAEDETSLAAEDKALLDGAREAVRAHWAPFRSLMAQAALRNELVPTLAFRRFCSGWEGKNLPAFTRSVDGMVSLDVMGEVPPVLIRIAGLRAYQMLWASASAGNSAPLLQSGKSLRPSNSDASKKAGTSGAKSGRKTRSS